MADPPLIGIRRVAARFDVSTATVRRWEREERLKSVARAPSGQRLFTVDAVNNLAAKAKAPERTPPKPKAKLK
jgi:predicted site-specific integrase-resolvase